MATVSTFTPEPLKGTFTKREAAATVIKPETVNFTELLKKKKIILPSLPKPVGNYQLFARSGNLIFINQISLKNRKVQNPGKVEVDVTEDQAKEATRTTMLNVLAILNEAVGGDLNRVKHVVQLTGYYNRHFELQLEQRPYP